MPTQAFRKYLTILTGETDMIQHADNIMFRDQMEEWRKDPMNKKKSKAGDDRTPAWTWIGGTYNDEKYLVVPTENLMRAMMTGATMVVIKGQKTFKRQSQSGITPVEMSWPIELSNGPVSWPKVAKLMDEPVFSKHVKAVRKMGFDLLIKSVRVQNSKHIRVRAKFSNWKLQGHLMVTDEMITTEVLQSILDLAGQHGGLCDWRPSSPRVPGPYGKFTATIKLVG